MTARNFDNFAIYQSHRGKSRVSGESLRKAVIGLLCLAVLTLCGCAKKDPAVERVEGSEPQRLAFGAPAAVQKAFTEQMKACWFNGPSALLSGYQYDTAAGGRGEPQQIRISSGQGPQAQIFVVQFNAFNENTLISTRNLSFPVELAAKMKRDVETWIFGRAECKEAAPPAGYAGVPSLAPQNSSVLQYAPTGGWTSK